MHHFPNSRGTLAKQLPEKRSSIPTLEGVQWTPSLHNFELGDVDLRAARRTEPVVPGLGDGRAMRWVGQQDGRVTRRVKQLAERTHKMGGAYGGRVIGK